MKEILKKVYYCDHCKKKSFVRKLTADHEAICWGNPATRPACADCIHLTKESVEYEGEERTVAQSPFCKKLNKYLHTQSATLRGYTKKYPDHYKGSELMPMKCEGQQQYATIDADTFL